MESGWTAETRVGTGSVQAGQADHADLQKVGRVRPTRVEQRMYVHISGF